MTTAQELEGSTLEAPPPLDDGTTPRASWWSQGLVVFGLCWAYDAINNLASLRRQQAFGHAQSILRLEQSINMAPERALNGWLAAHHTLGLVVSDYYDLLHFAVTLGLVGWLWWRHPARYRPLRNTLVGTNVIGLMIFWVYPLAPPRMLASAGFVDVVAASHAVGAWSSGALASQANELAAMPSLHMAWAVWCALAGWKLVGRRSAKLAVLCYPAATALVVIATANHYLLDVVAGVLTAAVAAATASGWERHRGARPR